MRNNVKKGAGHAFFNSEQGWMTARMNNAAVAAKATVEQATQLEATLRREKPFFEANVRLHGRSWAEAAKSKTPEATSTVVKP